MLAVADQLSETLRQLSPVQSGVEVVGCVVAIIEGLLVAWEVDTAVGHAMWAAGHGRIYEDVLRPATSHSQIKES